jgi:predicted ATP-grasp superfamily ATP-dependent carboligase
VLGNTDLIRPLALGGIRSIAVARPDSPMAQSRWVEERIEWADNWGDPDRLARNLIAYAERQPEPPPLFYQHDGDLAFVSRRRDTLRPHLRFVVGDAQLVEDLLDKTRFTPLAERLGLPIPRSLVLQPEPGSAPPDLPFGYPAIVKPLTRRDVVWRPVAGHHKAIRVGSAAELRALWPRLAQRGVGFVAQELIAGGEERIESYHVYVDDRGEVAGEFTGRKVRTVPREFGETTALTITDEHDVRSAGRDCMAALGCAAWRSSTSSARPTGGCTCSR